MTTAVSLRLPADVLHALDELGRRTDRSRTWLIRNAVEQYLAEQADYEIALGRLHDKDDPVVSGDELAAALGY